jgi:hypothetical protein
MARDERRARPLLAVIALLITYLYLHYILILFPWTRGLGISLSTLFTKPRNRHEHGDIQRRTQSHSPDDSGLDYLVCLEAN